MKTRTQLNKTLVVVGLFVCFSAACSRSTPNSQNDTAGAPEKRISSTEVVKASPAPIEIAAGKTADATIRLNIQTGYHVNANPPTFPYLKATELQIPATDGVSVGFIVYPDPLTKKFGFADEPLAVYEGETTLKVNLKADQGATKGSRALPAKLQVQACDDQVCYAPGVIELAIPVTVK